MVYDLNDEELKALTNNSVKQVPVGKRLEILNNVIKDDFAGQGFNGYAEQQRAHPHRIAFQRCSKKWSNDSNQSLKPDKTKNRLWSESHRFMVTHR